MTCQSWSLQIVKYTYEKCVGKLCEMIFCYQERTDEVAAGPRALYVMLETTYGTSLQPICFHYRRWVLCLVILLRPTSHARDCGVPSSLVCRQWWPCFASHLSFPPSYHLVSGNLYLRGKASLVSFTKAWLMRCFWFGLLLSSSDIGSITLPVVQNLQFFIPFYSYYLFNIFLNAASNFVKVQSSFQKKKL